MINLSNRETKATLKNFPTDKENLLNIIMSCEIFSEKKSKWLKLVVRKGITFKNYVDNDFYVDFGNITLTYFNNEADAIKYANNWIDNNVDEYTTSC